MEREGWAESDRRVVSFRLTAGEYDLLSKLAEKMDMTKTDVIKAGINSYATVVVKVLKAVD